MGGARLVGLLLIFLGAVVAGELGVRGRTPSQAWGDLGSFLRPGAAAAAAPAGAAGATSGGAGSPGPLLQP